MVALPINEVGVASSHRSRGIATKLLHVLFEVGRDLGCVQAWVLTDRTNAAAIRLYSSIGGIEAPKDQVMFTFNRGEIYEETDPETPTLFFLY